MPRFAVILPAAGRSTRFQGAEKKVFADLDGRPVWRRSVELFLSRSDVCQCIVVAAPEDRERFAAATADGRVQIADGGAERFESVANALALTTSEADFIAVHDAARPCATPEQIDAVFARAAETGAALLAAARRRHGQARRRRRPSPRHDPRQGLWLAQTPQVFRRDWLLDAYARRAALGGRITDDAQLVEAAGHAVHLVEGRRQPEDHDARRSGPGGGGARGMWSSRSEMEKAKYPLRSPRTHHPGAAWRGSLLAATSLWPGGGRCWSETHASLPGIQPPTARTAEGSMVGPGMPVSLGMCQEKGIPYT